MQIDMGTGLIRWERLAIGTGEFVDVRVARRVADRLKLRQDVFLAEIVLDPVYAAIEDLKDSRRYQPLPRFPAVERDFSLLLGDGTSFDAVKKTIDSLKIAEVVTVEAGDLYRGKNVPAGKYSLMVRVVFQNREATLTDAQAADLQEGRWYINIHTAANRGGEIRGQVVK